MKFPRKVYVIRHNKTDRIYVGSSSQVDLRIRSHLENLRRGRHPVEDMQSDYDSYGDDYTISVVDEIEQYHEREKEYQWMKRYRSFERGIGYNYKDQKWRIGKTEKNKTEVGDSETKIIEIIKNSKDPAGALIVATIELCKMLSEYGISF